MTTKKPSVMKKLLDFLVPFLREVLVKKALKAVLGSAVGGGIKVWLVKFIAENFYKEIGEPLTKYVVVEMWYAKDKVVGQLQYKRIKDARTNNDVEAYNDSVDDVFGGRSK